jgi:membrane-bound lytic murein transglycosylase B
MMEGGLHYWRLAIMLLLTLAAPFADTAPALAFQTLADNRLDMTALKAMTWPLAAAKGVERGIFDAAFEGLSPDPSLQALAQQQPEFSRPIQAYVATALAPQRIRRGQEAARRWRAELDGIERDYGIAREIVLAVWGMETDFARLSGEKDVIRTLATLALRDPEGSPMADLVAALVMLQSGVRRADLRGSWAGAMGYPQFLPTTYLKYAVSFNGQSTPDIWTSVPDSLASIANFLQKSGWMAGLAWGFEVKLPQGFAYQTLHGDFQAFARQGIVRADGRALPKGEATLFLPAGAPGPALLLAANYWVLKQYNNSDSYALSLALLAEAIANRPGLQKAWPAPTIQLDPQDQRQLQRLLSRLGFYHGTIDGKTGPATRDAVHDFQIHVGYAPADGFPTPALLAAVRRSAGIAD